MSKNASLDPVTQNQIKDILCNVFSVEKSIISNVIIDGEKKDCVQVNTVKPVTNHQLYELNKELYEHKIVVDWSLKRSGKGIRIVLY